MRVLRKSSVIEKTGLSLSTINRLEQAGTFPHRLKLGPGCVGWLESEVETFIRARAEARGVPQFGEAA
ncbi:MAG: helix-turn-helix transcriptional regulator [Alphaproteobacteria bacterium]